MWFPAATMVLSAMVTSWAWTPSTAPPVKVLLTNLTRRAGRSCRKPEIDTAAVLVPLTRTFESNRKSLGESSPSARFPDGSKSTHESVLRRRHLDVAIADPDLVAVALHRDAAALVLHQAACVPPETRRTGRSTGGAAVVSRKPSRRTPSPAVCTTFTRSTMMSSIRRFDEDAVHLLVDLVHRQVGAVDGQVVDRDVLSCSQST